jgi:putative NADPH-quinone reductase
MPEPQPTSGAASAEVLVLVAHPQMEQSRVNRRLMRAAGEVAATSRGRVEVRDLYALYPDYLIDVAAEQALLAQAKLIVWQHPVHWYSMPPLMKLWLDEVLAFGWAYGPGGTALQGKDLWLSASTGGPEDSYRPDSYNRYFFDAFLPPYEQTAALAGMRWCRRCCCTARTARRRRRSNACRRSPTASRPIPARPDGRLRPRRRGRRSKCRPRRAPRPS